MARPEVKRVGRSLRQRIEDDARRNQRPKRYAVVTRVHPLTAELTEGSLVLDEDDLVLGQWVEQYRKQYGLRKDDVLTVHRMHNGDWVADDVISDREMRRLKTKARKKAKGGGGEGSEEVSIPEEGSEELEDQEEAEEVEAEEGGDRSEYKGFCNHGIEASKGRPAGFQSVEWFGTVEPLKAQNSDTLIVPP